MADAADVRVYPERKELIQAESFEYGDNGDQDSGCNNDIYKDALLFSGFDTGQGDKVGGYVCQQHEKSFKSKGFVV